MLCCGKFVDTFIARVPRARRVGQSYLSSVVSSLAAACSCVPVLVTAQPQLLLANGPGTALPLLLLARLLAAVRLAAPCRISAANRLIGEFVQSRRRPLLGPSPG